MNNDTKCGFPGVEFLEHWRKFQYTEMKRLIVTLCLYFLSCSLTFSLQKFCDDFLLKKLTNEAMENLRSLLLS